jgi:hypothetical protein
MLRVSSSAVLAGMLGAAAALLVSCGSSTAKLIPVADAGPLQSDFEEVAQAAEAGDGDCSATQTAIAKTEQDFNELPSSVDAGLRDTLHQGIDNLRNRALTLCTQPLVQASTATTSKTTTSTTTTTPTTTPTSTTPTTTTPTTTTPTTSTPTSTTPGGGVVAPGESSPGTGNGQGGGTGVGEGASGENGAGAGAGGGGNPGVAQEGAR